MMPHIQETTVTGFVVGEYGRAGVRGRMAMRDGKLLMRAENVFYEVYKYLWSCWHVMYTGIYLRSFGMEQGKRTIQRLRLCASYP